MRATGASNFTTERLAAWLDASATHGLPRYETLQPEYTLMMRDFERALAPLCLRHELGVIPYFGLASGFLTGKYRSKADPQAEPARRGCRTLSQRARLQGAKRAAFGGGTPSRHARPGRARLADDQGDRPDRERHQSETARRSDGLGAADARQSDIAELEAASA